MKKVGIHYVKVKLWAYSRRFTNIPKFCIPITERPLGYKPEVKLIVIDSCQGQKFSDSL